MAWYPPMAAGSSESEGVGGLDTLGSDGRGYSLLGSVVNSSAAFSLRTMNTAGRN